MSDDDRDGSEVSPGGRDPERADGDSDVAFRDAEEWLAEQGIERRPIQVSPDPGTGTHDDTASGSEDRPPPAKPPPPGTTATQEPGEPVPDGAGGPDRPSDADAAATDQPGSAGQAPAAEEPGRLEDEVSEAVSFARRSTASTPQSEQRLADKMADRGYRDVVIEMALERCREQGIVDDATMAVAFVEERRRKGHAPKRIGRDLRRRGFDSETIDEALAGIDRQDQESDALEVARDKAASMGDVDDETAFRRLTGHLARRGYPEGLARRVCRRVLWDEDS